MDILRLAITCGIFYFTQKVVIAVYNYFSLRIKSEAYTIAKKDIYASLALACLITVGLIFFQPKDVMLGLLIGFFLCLFYAIMLAVIKAIVFLSTRAAVKQQRIETVNKSGFKLLKGTKSTQIYWNEIESIRLDTDKMKLTIRVKSKLVIDNSTPNFYCLLKNIPIGFSDKDYNYIRSFFSGLKPCAVCGTIAVREQKCLSCGCSTWNASMEAQYPNYEAYVKENQLDIFATMEPEEKFCEFKLSDKCFALDSNWSPMVTKAEVLAYSEKEYWHMQ